MPWPVPSGSLWDLLLHSAPRDHTATLPTHFQHIQNRCHSGTGRLVNTQLTISPRSNNAKIIYAQQSLSLISQSTIILFDHQKYQRNWDWIVEITKITKIHDEAIQYIITCVTTQPKCHYKGPTVHSANNKCTCNPTHVNRLLHWVPRQWQSGPLMGPPGQWPRWQSQSDRWHTFGCDKSLLCRQREHAQLWAVVNVS